MGDLRLKIYRDRPAEFWVAMGPFFASGRVRREMPYLRDEPDRAWIVASDERGVAGFAAMAEIGDRTAELSALWIRPDLRGVAGVGARLLDTQIRYVASIGCARARATANHRSRPLFARAGFVEGAKRGSYVVMERELEGALV